MGKFRRQPQPPPQPRRQDGDIWEAFTHAGKVLDGLADDAFNLV